MGICIRGMAALKTARLNAGSHARGEEQTRLTCVLRRSAEMARLEGASSATTGIGFPETAVVSIAASSEGTYVCTTSRPTTHAGPTLRGARRYAETVLWWARKAQRPGDATIGTCRTVTAVIRHARWSADGLAPAATLRRRTHAAPRVATDWWQGRRSATMGIRFPETAVILIATSSQGGHAHHRRAVPRTAPRRAGTGSSWDTRSATMATTGPMTAAAALATLSAGTRAPTRPPKTPSRPSARRFAETGCAEAWRSATTSTR